MNFPVGLFLLFLASTAIAAESGESTGKMDKMESVSRPSVGVSRSDAWKASSSTAFYDMVGTQAANKNAYAFGEVRVETETLGLEYAVSRDLKLLARTQYLNNDYELAAGGRIYDEKTHGFGDSYLGASHTLFDENGFRLSGDAGASLPTGSIDEMNRFTALPSHYKYFLQLGSGTFDGVLGLNPVYRGAGFSTGARATATLRAGENKDNYRLGNLYFGTAWFDLPAGWGFTPRLVGAYRSRGAIHGGDPMISRAAAEYYYHEQVDWNVSAALKYEHAFAGSLALAAEAGRPLWQGMHNFDNVVISARIYGTLTVAGQF
jgi:hypothetical protein